MSLFHQSSDGNNLTSWLKENRVMSNALLQKLDDLGANHVEDLVDLSDEDIESFQPILKKLEFIRFKRALSLLQTSQSTSHNNTDHDTDGRTIQEESSISLVENNNKNNINTNNGNLPPAIITIETNTTSSSSAASGKMSQVDILCKNNNGSSSKRTADVVAKEKRYWLEQQLQQQKQQQQKPPLPSTCPEKNCHGTLSAHQGKRRIKALIKLQGPDYRWIVTCSNCTTRWHACHFLCGYMSKISRPTGSSDIIRHEMGRYNRWQNKITPPCKNNPMSRMLSVEYSKEQVQSRLEKTSVVPHSKIPHDGKVTLAESSNVHDVGNKLPQQLQQRQQEQQQQQQQQQQNLNDNDEQEMSLTNSFLHELDYFPFVNGSISCPFTHKKGTSTSSSTSYSKRTKVNDHGEYTGGGPIMNPCTEEEDDEIDETCDEIKKLLLGECSHENDGNHEGGGTLINDCGITAE